MEFNGSSFYDGEETGKHQLNSTAVDQDENEQKEWKLSPIAAEGRRPTAIRKHLHDSEFKSPLRTINMSDPSTSGYDSKNTTQPSSSDPKISMSAELSSLIANNSMNPFDSIIINSLHKSINFSPRVIFSQESCSQQNDGEKFQWSVEQLAILKPAHISEDEIAASYRSPVPEVEEKIQEALNEYWTKNLSYIPSPDGPRLVRLTNRDGTVTTLQYGSDKATTSSTTSEKATPSLSNLVRKKEAVKAAYATSSPKQRPRNFRNVRQVRNRTCQTELTIPPSIDLDLKKILGDSFVFKSEVGEEDEEVFNVSVCSNFSTRRRLFSSGAHRDDNDDVANSSILSTDDPLLNESSSQPFNDSLSPVRRSEDITDEIDYQLGRQEDESSTSAATKSHASQIAINISILNDCMMNSIDEMNEEKDGEDKGNGEEKEHLTGSLFLDTHLHSNEYEMLDRSSSSNATPRHEDLDWTPRRICGSSGGAGSSSNSVVRRGYGGVGDRRFIFDMSPIHPNHVPNLGTPIQRCHFTNTPSGRLNLNDGDEEDDA